MITPPLHPWRLILASASPRRRQLLQGLDLPVEITSVDVDETPPAGMPNDAVAEHLARVKAEAWSGTLAPDQVLVTADTTVVIGDVLLNKPADAADARSMLGQLAGRTHRVITGVCLRTAQGMTSFADTTEVTFAPLTAAEIAYYVERYSPLDKAGAYGVQDWIGYVAVERIDGSFYTVMGLPLHRVYKALNELDTPAM
ncbi:MAG: septum formation protein Maf [Flavobacteriales bacterium]|nr:septum formation protein Maf [Flavobacteriales bacterium]